VKAEPEPESPALTGQSPHFWACNTIRTITYVTTWRGGLAKHLFLVVSIDMIYRIVKNSGKARYHGLRVNGGRGWHDGGRLFFVKAQPVDLTPMLASALVWRRGLKSDQTTSREIFPSTLGHAHSRAGRPKTISMETCRVTERNRSALCFMERVIN